MHKSNVVGEIKMAIQKTLGVNENENKYQYPAAYIRVYDVEVRISSDDVRIYIQMYADKNSRDLNGYSVNKIVERVKFSKFKNYLSGGISPDSFKAAAYAYLKTEMPNKYFGIDC